MPEIGRTVMHNRILGSLGGGAMGVVYRAEGTALDRPWRNGLSNRPPLIIGGLGRQIIKIPWGHAHGFSRDLYRSI
jgi:hypothetical protein